MFCLVLKWEKLPLSGEDSKRNHRSAQSGGNSGACTILVGDNFGLLDSVVLSDLGSGFVNFEFVFGGVDLRRQTCFDRFEIGRLAELLELIEGGVSYSNNVVSVGCSFILRAHVLVDGVAGHNVVVGFV